MKTIMFVFSCLGIVWAVGAIITFVGSVLEIVHDKRKRGEAS